MRMVRCADLSDTIIDPADSWLFYRPDRDAAGIDHGRFQAGMVEQVLDHTDIVTGLEQVGSEGVAEDVGGYFFGDFCLADGIIERLLHVGFMEMIPSPFSAADLSSGKATDE